MRSLISTALVFMCCFATVTLLQAQTATMSYQGLLESGGVSVNMPQNLTFSLHTALTGGTEVWTETQNAVPVTDGLYNVELGSVTSLEGVDFNVDLWMAVIVGATVLSPRTKLTGVPYAHTLQVPAVLSGEAAGSGVLQGTNTSTSNSSSGVYGQASAGSGFTYGVQGENSSDDGSGVYGFATASSGFTIGVRGENSSTDGRGVFGRASAFTGTTYGVYGVGESTDGRGVYGEASAFTGTTYGVYGTSISSSGRGVYGWAAANSGTTYGVWGEVTSSNGYAGYFRGGRGILVDNVATDKRAAFLSNDGGNGSSGTTLFAINNSTNAGIAGWFETNGTDATLVVDQDGSGDLIKGFSGADLRFRVDNAGNVTADGSINGGGADLAEAFNVEGSPAAYEPGDVLAISLHTDRTVEQSDHAYSTRIVGVYATKPGVLLNDQGLDAAGDRIPMGVLGVIPTKVTAENGPIQRGDLLVSASTPGHAMKADPSKLGFGMVLGKALEGFTGPGAGVIQVMVNVK